MATPFEQCVYCLPVWELFEWIYSLFPFLHRFVCDLCVQLIIIIGFMETVFYVTIIEQNCPMGFSYLIECCASIFSTLKKQLFFYRKSARHFSVVWVCVYWSVPVSQNNRTKAKQCSRNLRLETKSMAKQSRQLSVHSYQRDRLADQSQFDANDRTHLSNWKG